jgi:hypothetical protein
MPKLISVKRLSIYEKFFKKTYTNNLGNFKIPKFDTLKYFADKEQRVRIEKGDHRIADEVNRRGYALMQRQTTELELYSIQQSSIKCFFDFNTLSHDFFKELGKTSVCLSDIILLNTEYKRASCISLEYFLKDHKVFYTRADVQCIGPIYHISGLSSVTQFILRLLHSILISILPDEGHGKYMFSKLNIFRPINEYHLLYLIFFNINHSSYLAPLILSWLDLIKEEDVRNHFFYFLSQLGLFLN